MNDRDRPEQIERDIEQTRAEVSATIDAIQSKLSPGQMVDEGIRYLRTSLPADFGRNLADTARNNPVPIALIGIGIAWLAMSGNRSSPAASTYPSVDLTDTEDTGPSMTERARDAAGHARERVGQTVRGAQETAHQLTDRSRRAYRQARSTVAHVAEDQPLVLGAIGLAVGAALGAAVPRTEQEDALMGDARDHLVDDAAESARDYAERARDSANRAMRTLADRGEESTTAQAEYPPGGGI